MLSPEVQLTTGPETGAVLGWFDEVAVTGFVYPETTGYYLTFLSFLEAQPWPAPDLHCHARWAAEWLGRWNRLPEPPTRLYLAGPQTKDWRNHLAFSFDLAMIWRGLAMTHQLGGDVVCERLLRFCKPRGRLLASVPVHPGPVAHPWSIEPGAFQMKTAAALLYSGVNPPPGLDRRAKAVLAQFSGWSPEDCPRHLLHPYLYAVEGALMAGLAVGDDALLRQAAAIIGELVLVADNSRSDVLAQLLRSGCILQAAGYLPRAEWEVRLPELAKAVCRFCGPDGRMYFQRDRAGRLQHVNVWSGLFAAQALIWFDLWRASELSLESAAWLV